MQEMKPPLPLGIFETGARVFEPSPAEVGVIAVRVGGPDVLRNHVRQQPVTLLTVAEFFLREFAVGHVMEVDRETFRGRIGSYIEPDAEGRVELFEMDGHLLRHGASVLSLECSADCAGELLPQVPADELRAGPLEE